MSGVRVIVILEGLPDEAANSWTVSIPNIALSLAGFLAGAVVGYAKGLRRMHMPRIVPSATKVKPGT